MQLEKQIEALLLEKFRETGYEDFFLIEVQLHKNKKLDVFVDSDSGLTLRHCSILNRYLQNHIDEAGWLGEKYTLDVSSPGVDKPLKLLRQYRKNINRSLKLTLMDDSEIKGKLTEVSDDSIKIEYTIVSKKGKKKIKENIQQTVLLDTVKKAIVQITF